MCAVRWWGNPHRFPFIGVYWPRALLLGVFFCLAARELFGFGVGLPWLPSRGNPMNCSGYRALSQAAGSSCYEQLFGESPGQRSESSQGGSFPQAARSRFPWTRAAKPEQLFFPGSTQQVPPQKPQRESFFKKVVDSLKCISYSIEVKQMEK